MDAYIGALKICLTENSLDCGGEKAPSILEILLRCCREQKSGDTEDISMAFDRMDGVRNNRTRRRFTYPWEMFFPCLRNCGGKTVSLVLQ